MTVLSFPSSRPAVTMAASGESLSYDELSTRSAQLANALLAMDMVPGDRIAGLLDNQLEAIVIMRAARLAGFDLLLLDPYLEIDQQLELIARLAPRAVMVSDRFADSVNPMIMWLPSEIRRIMVGRTIDGWERYDALLAAATTKTPTLKQRGNLLLLSSNAFEQPKIVVRSISDTDPTTFFSVPVQTSDRALLSVPLSHPLGGGWALALIALGVQVVIASERDSAQQLLKYSKDHEVTLLMLESDQMASIAALPPEVLATHDTAGVRLVQYVTQPGHAKTTQHFLEIFPNTWGVYDPAERVGRCAISPKDWHQHLGSVGRPLPGYRVTIRDEEDNELAPDHVGIIWFWRADRAQMQYLGHPEATAQCYNKHGEGTNFDLGKVDKDGFLYVVDRVERVINVDGASIWPSPIEEALRSHGAVANAYVLGIPHPELGEVPVAIIQLHPGRQEGPSLTIQLRDLCHELLPDRSWVPARFFFAALPRQESGRVRLGDARDLVQAQL